MPRRDLGPGMPLQRGPRARATARTRPRSGSLAMPKAPSPGMASRPSLARSARMRSRWELGKTGDTDKDTKASMDEVKAKGSFGQGSGVAKSDDESGNWGKEVAAKGESLSGGIGGVSEGSIGGDAPFSAVPPAPSSTNDDDDAMRQHTPSGDRTTPL